MTQLSETQTTILRAAALRADGNLLPLPGSLRGGAAAKVVGALLARGLAFETTTDSRIRADAALNRFWRYDEDGRAVLLLITEAGRAAVAPREAHSAHQSATEAPSASGAAEDDAPAHAAHTARPWRENTKQATLIAMLRAEGGATVAEIAAATGWQRHSVRGAIAGALRKKLGLTITSEKVEGRGRVHRIAG